MRSTITARSQTVLPAPICERFGHGPSTRLEWSSTAVAQEWLG